MKYLIVGSGGREHALAWRLLNDGSASEVFVAPGNGGIESRFRVDIEVDDFEGISRFSKDNGIDMVVIGPEAPLSDGIVDFLEGKGIPVFGPSKKAAQLESSKLFAKKIMDKYGIPTCNHIKFHGKKDLLEHVEKIDKYPVVIKLDGLAAGKGVGIPENYEEAIEFIDRMIEDDSEVFIEEYLQGEEASVLGISDGEDVVMMISAQDHKRIFDGDKGPNTGGMGAYAPAPVMTDERMNEVFNRVLIPAVRGMKNEGIPFKGVLYAGIMVCSDGIKVLEFNVRFGDPEIQVILPLLNEKFGDLLMGAVEGNLGKMKFTFSDKHAITVVMSSGGYPGDYERGIEIKGFNDISQDIIVFHAGTNEDNGQYYTNGGRVLNVTGLGDSIKSAREKVYNQIDKILFRDSFYRKDIAHRALKN